jgi:divalent metal cation (Fe/Co/Zn/Cd) transporter
MSQKKLTLKYLVTNISVVIGVVLIWRGIWYVLDELDAWLLGGSHIWTALLGIVAGLLILYIPDKDLKEIGKL